MTGNDGKKEPLCCFKFLRDGKCDNQEKFGEKCRYEHIDRAEYNRRDAAIKKEP